MIAKVIKIVEWTLGMTVSVHLIWDGKSSSASPYDQEQHAMIGAAIGLILGIIFSQKLGTKAVN